jgi:site-specific recombinase XerD
VVNPELLQDRAIFETLYGSGLRRTEAATLRLGNILDRSRLRVIGKRDKERVTMITESQYRAIRDWVLATLADAHSRELEHTVSMDAAFDDLKRRLPGAALFYTTHGKPLESLADPGRFIWERCRAHFNRLKATGGRPHRFRHSFFTDLLDGGCDLDTAAELGGHASVNTTRGYRALTERGIALARRAHPRG